MKFRIKLNVVHQRSGLTFYRVSKDTKLAHNTVQKYADAEVVSPYLPTAVVVLSDYYGVSWRDPEIVEVIDG